MPMTDQQWEAARLLDVDPGGVRDVFDLLRRIHGYPDAYVGEALGITRAAVAAKRAGLRRLSPTDVVGLCDIFDVPLDVFGMDPEGAVRWMLDNERISAALKKSMCITAKRSHRRRPSGRPFCRLSPEYSRCEYRNSDVA